MLADVPGVEVLNETFFNEFTFAIEGDAAALVERMAASGVLGGVPVSRLLPRAGLDDLILVATTEVNTEADRAAFVASAWKESVMLMLEQTRRVVEPLDDDRTPATFTGNRGLDQEEPLIFEIGRPEATGVDLDEPAPFEHRLGALERKAPIGLPGLTEPETMRHYVRLSRKNYSIDAGIYPLGSCTMKHNPRLNEKMARLSRALPIIHPLQPQSTVQGALELMQSSPAG